MQSSIRNMRHAAGVIPHYIPFTDSAANPNLTSWYLFEGIGAPLFYINRVRFITGYCFE